MTTQLSRLALGSLLLASLALAADDAKPPGTKPVGPLSPREELASFQIAGGFRVELVAAEPEVIDPVAMTFDEDGRLFVVEMRGYPNGGIGEGKPVLPGRVKLLEDKDGDGYFETSTVYVDELRFPTGVTPWKGGILIANAPDILYCKDTNGDGKADVKTVLYTGFGQKNIQQLVNGLQFHFDNWIHACNGSNDSVIRSMEKQDAPAVALRGRHLRFKPDAPASLEPMSGGGQYGLAADDNGNWFTCTNSQHLRHIVLPDHYLKRNPHLAVPSVVLDIPDGNLEHTPAAKVHRISPFEAWRVDRTTRRAGGADSKRFATTELVPGGYVTSATGLILYRGGLYPKEYDGNSFVCDPANNLIHRDALLPVGPTFIAKRGEPDCEFLASTDTWFRPVFLCNGPDGAIYVADFYREVIETPLSLPEDIQKQYNLQSRGRGRIWRIVSTTTEEDSKSARKPHLSKLSDSDLVPTLAHPIAWHRLTAQRLLIERQPKDEALIRSLRLMAHTGPTSAGRLHAMWTLEGLGQLRANDLLPGLRDRTWQVRAQALRLAEPFFEKDRTLKQTALALVNDPVPRVRFQLAFSIGEMKLDDSALDALAYLMRKDGVNPWTQIALLSSVGDNAGRLVADIADDESIAAPLVAKLSGMVVLQNQTPEITALLKELTAFQDRLTPRRLEILAGATQALSRRGQSLSKWVKDNARESITLDRFVDAVVTCANDDKLSIANRKSALPLLAHADPAIALPQFDKLLAPQTPTELQVAAVQALATIAEPKAAEVLLAHWASFTPAIRREVQEAVFARADRLPALLAAMEQGRVAPAQLDFARREQLLKNPKHRQRAEKLFTNLGSPDRKVVIEKHRKALELPADADRGKLVFKKNCATCHRLENEGTEVGPDLLSALKNKTAETLLTDILDPNREVDLRYLNYVASTKSGRTISGLIASESASSIVLRRAEKAEDTLLRSEIDEIASTTKSLMPDGLEQQMNAQEIADVIAYLQAVSGKK